MPPSCGRAAIAATCCATGARIEIGIRRFLEQGNFKGFTTTFENLYGFHSPGLVVQRLMADGYGFGAEGDWKTAASVRAMKVMAAGLHGGAIFMEDYTYHLRPDGMMVLGAHMLEVCPTIASRQPPLEVHVPPSAVAVTCRAWSSMPRPARR